MSFEDWADYFWFNGLSPLAIILEKWLVYHHKRNSLHNGGEDE